MSTGNQSTTSDQYSKLLDEEGEYYLPLQDTKCVKPDCKQCGLDNNTLNML